MEPSHPFRGLSVSFVGLSCLVACGSTRVAATAQDPAAAQASVQTSERELEIVAQVARLHDLAGLEGAELRVRLNGDLGPNLSPDGKLFSARLVAPVLDRRGVVLLPAGALLLGRVIHVDEAQRRIELAFERLETRGGVYGLRATVIAAQPFAQTVAPGAPTEGSDHVVLQGVAPDALGGGPKAPESEAEEGASRGQPIVPFDAELRLRAVGPVVRATE